MIVTSNATAEMATVVTPCGPFTVVARDDTVLASGWTEDTEALVDSIAPVLRPDRWRRRHDLGPLTTAVLEYLGGDLNAIDGVAVGQHSGPFVEHVWRVLRTVPAGAPVSYTELAARSGRPAAIRAVGNACGRNPVALFVPCHRVLRRGGDLGGFRWGLDVKRWLLGHEAHQNGNSVTLPSFT